MTRRRAIKKLMGMGMSRNEAASYLKSVVDYNPLSYSILVEFTALMIPVRRIGANNDLWDAIMKEAENDEV